MTEAWRHADDYLAYVHKIDHFSARDETPRWGLRIAKLPGASDLTPRLARICGPPFWKKRLGKGKHFEAGFDIIAAELEAEAGAGRPTKQFLNIHHTPTGRPDDIGRCRDSPQPSWGRMARHDYRASGARRRQGVVREEGDRRPRPPPMSTRHR